jgi:hypothetical protein
MARLCTVCAHPQRWDIDVELVRHAESYRAIARQFGVSRDSLQRHERAHLAMSLQQSQELLAMLSGKNLLAKVAELDGATREMLDTARKWGDLRTALMAVRESRSNIEAYARIDPVNGREQRVATFWDEREQERQHAIRTLRSALGMPPDAG